MKAQAKWTVLILAVLFFGSSFVCWLKPAGEYSAQERRKLEQFPKFTLETAANGKFMTDFESYTLDQFPMRNTFRRLKAGVHYGILQQKDNNGIYIADGYAAKLEYPLNQASVNYAVNKLTDIYETYLKDHESPEDIEYYMCGPGPMSKAVENMLYSLGVPRENLMFDNFGA